MPPTASPWGLSVLAGESRKRSWHPLGLLGVPRGDPGDLAGLREPRWEQARGVVGHKCFPLAPGAGAGLHLGTQGGEASLTATDSSGVGIVYAAQAQRGTPALP